MKLLGLLLVGMPLTFFLSAFIVSLTKKIKNSRERGRLVLFMAFLFYLLYAGLVLLFSSSL